MKSIIHIDLFAGCKGFRLALDRAGIPVKKSVSIEKSKFKNRVNRYNYPDDIQLGDINECSTEDIISRLVERPDLVTFGWPCQDNSNDGNRRRHNGAGSSRYPGENEGSGVF